MNIVPSNFPQDKPYVYIHSYPETMGGYAFYIGKGTGERINNHEVEAKTGNTCNPYKVNTIKKIWDAGEQVDKAKVASFETDDEAFLYETALIFFMRPYGHLTNIIDSNDEHCRDNENSAVPARIFYSEGMGQPLRRAHRKQSGFNLLGTYLEWLYGKLGIASDKELAEQTGGRVHQTTISTIKRTHKVTQEILLILLDTLRKYPGWNEKKYIHDFYIAANLADPRDQQKLQKRLAKVDALPSSPLQFPKDGNNHTQLSLFPLKECS